MSTNRIAVYCDALKEAKLLDPGNFQFKRIIPRKKGFFAWFDKVSGDVVFVGKATGGKGLYGRIIDQELNERYLDCNQEKWNHELDSFQVNNAVKYKGELGIDKSSLRKGIARKFELRPGSKSAAYVRDNFLVSFVLVKDEDLDDAQAIADGIKESLKPLY